MSAAARPPAASGEPLLQVQNLVKHYPVTAGLMGQQVAAVKAVDGVDFTLERGRTLGLVGESGCGKSTVGRCVLRLEAPTAGRVFFEGRDITSLEHQEMRSIRRELQIVFQDPFSSLNPRMTIADIVGEALRVHGIAQGREVQERVAATLAKVGIPPAWINRYPHEFSGGQRQRISIARAIAVDPKLVVCDEAVSALDVSIQAQVLNLLVDLRREMGLAYLFISHDLSVVRHVSDDVAVMYLGQLVERAPAEDLFERPAHPYTRALLSAIPVPDPARRSERVVLEGDVPTPLDPPAGCRFHTRCPAAEDRCRSEVPAEIDLGGGHRVACVHAEGLAGAGADAAAAIDERIARASAAREAAREVVPTPPVEAFVEPEAEAEADGVARGSGESFGGGDAEGALAALHAFAARSWPPSAQAVGYGLAVVACVFGLGRRNGTAIVLALASWVILGAGWFGGAEDAAASEGQDESGWLHGLVVAGAIGSTLILSLFLGRAFEQAAEFHRADRELAALHEEIGAFEELHGRLPRSLSEIGWRASLVLDGDDRDPWGQRWRYARPGTGGRPYDLGSPGPDGVVGSQDDVGELGVPPGLRLSPKPGEASPADGAGADGPKA